MDKHFHSRTGFTLVELPVLSKRRRAAFTLVELLVVIAIIAILIALLLPAVQAAREAARRSQCINHLKQIGLAVHNFHDIRGGVPPAATSGTGHATWMVSILPYLEQQSLYEVSNIGDNTQYYSLPASVRTTQVVTYYCPSRRSPPQLSVSGEQRASSGHKAGALTDYAMCGGDGTYVHYYCEPEFGNGMARDTNLGSPCGGHYHSGVLSGSPWLNQQYTGWKILRHFRQVTDGLSNSFLAGEKYVHSGHMGAATWGDISFFNDDGPNGTVRQVGPGHPILRNPDDTTVPEFLARNVFGSVHASVCHFVLGDASVRGVSPSINTTVLGYLANIRDGNVVAPY